MDYPPHDPTAPTDPAPQPAHGQPQARTQAPARVPDPGSGTSRAIAILCAVLFGGLAILWQNTPVEAQYRAIGQTPPAAPENAPAIGTASQVSILGRVYIRMNHLYEGMGMPMGGQSMPFIDQSALTFGDQIAAAVCAAELLDDPQEALTRLEQTREELLALDAGEDADIEPDTRDKYLLDIDHLVLIYTDQGDRLSEDDRERLVTRYSYFGKLANTHGLDDDAPARAELLSGGGAIITVLLLIGTLMLVVFLTGLVLLAVGAVGLSTRRLKMAFVPPAPGGSVFIEVYALFVAGFLVMTVGTSFVAVHNEPLAGLVSLGVQWTLLLVPFWPLLRGMNGREYRLAIGLHKGRGVIREIWAGLLAYIASVPVFFFGVAITVLLMFIVEAIRMANGGDAAPPPENPVIDIVGSGDPVVLVLIFLLATVWAPITEELVFRGALYRAVRSRLAWPAAALIVGLLFAFLHAYGPLMVSPLIALGFMFSFMREWRGSIIACMTAHFVHNFSVFCIAGTLIYLLS